MNDLSIPKLLARRFADERMLIASVFVGVTIAIAVGSLAPLYLGSLNQLAFRTSLEQTGGKYLNARIFAPNLAIGGRSLQESESALERAIETHLPDVYARRDLSVRSKTFLAGLPGREPPGDGERGEARVRGFVQHLSGLGDHVSFLAGQPPTTAVSLLAGGPQVEAMVSRQSSETHGIGIGDAVTLAAAPGAETRITAVVAAIVEPADPRNDYWRFAGEYLAPTTQTEEQTEAPQAGPADSPVGLFVSRGALIEAVAETTPRGLVDVAWSISIDKDRLAEWPVCDTIPRFDTLEDELRLVLPGSRLTTGPLEGLIDDLEKTGLYSGVPILLLLSLMVASVLLYMSMMASYLTRSRGRDTALLRSRGLTGFQLIRLYVLTGLAITLVAIPIALGLAWVVVASSGKLPYFQQMTGGELMSVPVGAAPVLVAVGVGLLCLCVLVVQGATSVRRGLLFQKLDEARPPGTSWFHRYYLDVAVLSIGGLLFWELHSRGQIVPGGLFEDGQVNEPLLFAPVLFLASVALVFIRLFPLLLRFGSGQSPALAHLLAAASVLGLVAGIGVRDRTGTGALEEAGMAAVLLAVAALYMATWRARRRDFMLVALLLQAALVSLFLVRELPDVDGLMFAAAIGLMALVPAQLAFLALRAFIPRATVWVSVALLHMGRDPSQHTSLVLVLVLATGLGVVASSVGGTLQTSRTESVRYELASDLRVTGDPDLLAGGMRGVRDSYAEAAGVAATSLALRTAGTVGSEAVDVLAVESLAFPRVAWHRDDFSDRPFGDVIGRLHSEAGGGAIRIPEGATEIGVWIKPLDSTGFMSLWAVLKDSAGAVETITLGALGPADWHLVKAEVPAGLVPPLHLSSLQVFEPGGQPAEDASGIATGTAGELLLDDVIAILGPGEQAHILDDFEGSLGWSPIVTAPIPSDTITAVAGDVHGGDSAGRFTFGRYRNISARGLYRGPHAGAVPMAISSSLADTRGLVAGDRFIAIIAGRMVPGFVVDTFRYFPTLGTQKRAFIVADLQGLLGYVNMLGQPDTVEPNELFIAMSADTATERADVAAGLRAMLLDVEDGAERLRAVRADPFSGAGLEALVLIAVGIVLLTAAFGYITHLLWFAKRGRAEMAFLRSMGLSYRQLVGLLSMQHLIVATIGLALGTWAGVQASDLMMSSLTVGEAGGPAVPPYRLATDWRFMGPAYAGLIAAFLGSLVFLTRGVRRLDLQAVARTAE